MFNHKEFLTTGAAKHHHEITPVNRPYPQYFKVVLRSADRDAGSTKLDARFSGVAINAPFQTPAVLVVESFRLSHTSNATLVNSVIELRLRGINQPRTWESSTKSASDLLTTFKGYEYQNGSACVDSIGVPVTDPNLFQNNSLNVYFTTGDNSALTEFAGEWVLVLNVVALDGSVPM